jgi:hypothetical protein
MEVSAMVKRALAVLVFVLVLVGACVALAAWVGMAAAKEPEEFDWRAASQAAVAAGTIVLAAFAGALAWSIGRDVSETRRLAELAAEDRQARNRPAVVIARSWWSDQRSGGDRDVRLWKAKFHVEYRNVGLGPAMQVTAQPTYDRGEATIQFTPETDSVAAISPDGFYEFVFDARWTGEQERQPDALPADAIPVQGSYVDRTLDPETSEEVINLRNVPVGASALP